MTTFAELDDAEVEMCCRVGEMDADDLLAYFVLQQKLTNDIEVTTRPRVDPGIFSRLIDDYPQPRAGKIVKWLFYKHKGKATWDKQKQIVRTSQFSASWRWMVEQWWTQVQMDAHREKRRAEAPASTTFASVLDL